MLSADMSSSVHIGYKKNDILILGNGPTNSLDDTMLTKEKEYFINFTEQQKKFCLSWRHNEVIILYLFLVLIYKFKAKYSKRRTFSSDKFLETEIHLTIRKILFILP